MPAERVGQVDHVRGSSAEHTGAVESRLTCAYLGMDGCADDPAHVQCHERPRLLAIVKQTSATMLRVVANVQHYILSRGGAGKISYHPAITPRVQQP
jgi:hypothetical protein